MAMFPSEMAENDQNSTSVELMVAELRQVVQNGLSFAALSKRFKGDALKRMAAHLNIHGRSKMRTSELLEAIVNHVQAESDSSATANNSAVPAGAGLASLPAVAPVAVSSSSSSPSSLSTSVAPGPAAPAPPPRDPLVLIQTDGPLVSSSTSVSPAPAASAPAAPAPPPRVPLVLVHSDGAPVVQPPQPSQQPEQQPQQQQLQPQLHGAVVQSSASRPRPPSAFRRGANGKIVPAEELVRELTPLRPFIAAAGIEVRSNLHNSHANAIRTYYDQVMAALSANFTPASPPVPIEGGSTQLNANIRCSIMARLIGIVFFDERLKKRFVEMMTGSRSRAEIDAKQTGVSHPAWTEIVAAFNNEGTSLSGWCAHSFYHLHVSTA